MEVKNIDKYFDLEILRRGYDYYKKGNVLEITKSGNEYFGKVNGSEVYNVTIIDEDVIKMSCSCPYAEEHNCKHMAAVLYCLKHNSIPVKESVVKVNFDDVTNFQKFERLFKKEFYKLFHGRYYITDNELNDYENLIYVFADDSCKYIGVDNYLAYDIFEYLLLNVGNLDVYDRINKKEKIYAYLFDKFSEVFKEEGIFSRFISFLKNAYLDSDSCFYYDCDDLVDILSEYISLRWQAELLLKMLNKLYNDRRIDDYIKEHLLLKIVVLNYNFVDQKKGLEIANSSLDVKSICDFLISLYDNNLDKKIELLKRIIEANKDYCDDEYYEMLLEIYSEKDADEYLKLLKKYFLESPSLETYIRLKELYDVKTWINVRSDYLKLVRDYKHLYMDICIEEGMYYEVLDILADSWILSFNDYLDVLICHIPESLLGVYKEKVVEEVAQSFDRKGYRKCFDYFLNLMKIPGGEEELKKIITDIKVEYTNKRALLEEVEFFESTYL